MFILLFYVILAFTSYRVARFLYRGYRCRSTIRSLKNQNIPIASHSILFGYLHIFAEFKRQHPPDVNIYVFHTWLVQNFTKFFPGETRPPPVVYLDLWPVQGIYTLAYDASAAAQFIQVESLPKYFALTQYLIPLTSNNDILSTDGDEWKTWRTRFNPSFISRNITNLLPDPIEEVMVFVDGLKQAAGPQRKWGDVIQLEKRTTNLSFDIIARATINMRLHEQLRDEPSPLQHAFYEQMQAMGQMTNQVGRLLLKLSPWRRARVLRNNRIIQDALEPQILKRLNLEQDESNISRAQTLVDVALASTTNTKENTKLPQFPGDSFVNTLISNLKSFVFAGHDTIASTICFMVKCLEDN